MTKAYTRLLPALALGALLAGCASDDLGGMFSTASIAPAAPAAPAAAAAPAAPRVDTACLQLAGQIDQLKKDGTPYKNAGCIDPEAFGSLTGFVSRKVREIGTEILDGEASVSPVEYKGESPCTYCPYAEVCGFDRRVPGYEVRTLPTMKQDEAMQLICDEMKP